MKNIKTYLNILDQHRDEMALALMSDPGLSKTSQCKQWCEEHGRRYFEFITSQRMPSEISGMAMPDQESKRMKIYDFDYLLDMKDGDMLAFDEFTNGNIMTLNACLTLIQERNMMSGRKLPSILIVAMGNPQGKCDMLPQIKQRFIWLHVKFDEEAWLDWVKKELNVVPTARLVNKIRGAYSSGFDIEGYNYMTARTVTNLLKLAKTVDQSNPIWSNMYGVSESIVTELYKSVSVDYETENFQIMRNDIGEMIGNLSYRSDVPFDELAEFTKKLMNCNTISEIKILLSSIMDDQSMSPCTKDAVLDALQDENTEWIVERDKLLKALEKVVANEGFCGASVKALRDRIKSFTASHEKLSILDACLRNDYGAVGTSLYAYVKSNQIFEEE